MVREPIRAGSLGQKSGGRDEPRDPVESRLAMTDHSPGGLRDVKRAWRERLRAARAAVPDEVHAAEARQLTDAALALVRHVAGPVCCYVPVGTEPGSVDLLEALRAAGHQVLLPIVPREPAGERGPLSWAAYRGEKTLEPAPFGLRQPGGRELGPAAVATAELILVPALAVDRRGVRVGQGAGWYDRTLPLAGPDVPLVGVVRDDEVVDALPRERHDVRLTGVLTPGRGLRALPLEVD
jgi:5-formyltetrahydrofolate cyclo-ligase